MLRGKWTGAMKKDTLYEAPQWTRDNNLSLIQTATQMIECASQWDQEFYDQYSTELVRAIREAGMEIDDPPPYGMLSRTVAERDSLSGHDFSGWRAEGPGPGKTLVGATDALAAVAVAPTRGLTTLRTQTLAENTATDRSALGMLAAAAVNEAQMDLEYGLESNMLRTQVEWNTNQAQGQVIENIQIPFGILALANPDNIQNMAFQRFIYTVHEVELTMQVSAQPLQQGCLLAFFYPLSAEQPTILNATMCDGACYLSPNNNTSATVTVPFRHFRSALNTYAGGMGEESLGTFQIHVLSPLYDVAGEGTCTIAIYSRFVAKFTIARPIPLGSDLVTGRQTRRQVGFVAITGDDSVARTLVQQPTPIPPRRAIANGEQLQFRAEGQNTSVINNTTNVNAGSVGGDMPVQGGDVTSKNDQKAEGSISLPMPMDNPPLASGGIPVFQQFSSMSKAVGVHPTTAMQLHPQQMFREHLKHFDSEEMMIEKIMNRRGLYKQFNWTTEDANDKVLLTMPINSILRDANMGDISTLRVPLNVALLNYFLYWRADVVLDFLVVRNANQNGRLCVTMAYGAPGIVPGDKNLFVNNVMEFYGENSWGSVTIPYNAATEFLMTYCGPAANNLVQNYSMGSLMVSVQNQLKVTGQIALPHVQVLVFVSFANVRLYELRNNPTCILDTKQGTLELNAIQSAGAQNQEQDQGDVFRAEGPEDGRIEETEEEKVDETRQETVPLTESETQLQVNAPCKLDLGRKFEYCITNLMEITRRYSEFEAEQFVGNTESLPNLTTAYRMFEVRPRNPFRGMFAGWAGHLMYRFFVRGFFARSATVKVVFIPDDGMAIPHYDHLMNIGDSENARDSAALFSMRQPDDTLFYGPVEMMTQVGNGMYYVDVEIPFNTIFNFKPTETDQLHKITNRIGWIMVVADYAGSNQGQLEFERLLMFEKTGDDFAFGVFRPPVESRFQPWVLAPGVTSPVTGLNVAGYFP